MAKPKKSRRGSELNDEDLLAQLRDAERRRVQQLLHNPQRFQDEEKLDTEAVFKREQERRRGLVGPITREKRPGVVAQDQAAALDREKAEAEHKAWAEQLLKSLGESEEHQHAPRLKPRKLPKVSKLSKLLTTLEQAGHRDILVRALHLWMGVHHELKQPQGKLRRPGLREEKYKLLKATAANAQKIARKASALAKDFEDLISRSMLRHLSARRSVPAQYLQVFFRDTDRLGTSIPTREEAVSLKELSSHLESAAAILDNKLVPLYQKLGSRKRQYGSDAYPVVFLHCFLKRTTRHSHHQELSDLLNAALSISASPAQNHNPYWNAKKLAKRIREFRKRYPGSFRQAEQAAELAARGRFGPPEHPLEAT